MTKYNDLVPARLINKDIPWEPGVDLTYVTRGGQAYVDVLHVREWLGKHLPGANIDQIYEEWNSALKASGFLSDNEV